MLLEVFMIFQIIFIIYFLVCLLEIDYTLVKNNEKINELTRLELRNKRLKK